MNDLKALTTFPPASWSRGARPAGETAAEMFAAARRRLIEGGQGADGKGRLLAVPAPGELEMRDLERGLRALVEGVIHTNLRCAEAILQAQSPRAFAELQQQFMADYIKALLNGVSVLQNSTRRLANETARCGGREVPMASPA